jgi:ribonuclease-3
MDSHSYIRDGYIIYKDNGEEDIIPIAYNPNNILISENDIKNLLLKYGIKIDKVNHIEYFYKAFTHKSYLKKDIIPKEVLLKAKDELGNPPNLLELRDESYERLEYLGDRVIKLILSKYLFLRYPHEDEGFMTRLQTKIEDKTNLTNMSKEIGLEKWFIIARQIEITHGRSLDKIHEDVFEAFMGALFLSNGYEPCLLLLINLLETMIDYSDKLYCDSNYKDKLLRLFHSNSWKYPKYEVIYYEGPPHKRMYLMGVLKNDIDNNTCIEDKYVGFGVANSKKAGEQKAAKMALITFGILKDDQYIFNDLYYPKWNLIKEAFKYQEEFENNPNMEEKEFNILSNDSSNNSKDNSYNNSKDNSKNNSRDNSRFNSPINIDDIDGDELDIF